MTCTAKLAVLRRTFCICRLNDELLTLLGAIFVPKSGVRPPSFVAKVPDYVARAYVLATCFAFVASMTNF